MEIRTIIKIRNLEHKNDVFGYICKVIDEIWNIKDVREDVSEAVGLAVPLPLTLYNFQLSPIT